MQLFCAKCEKDVTDNIAVYENVDSVIVHCGDCNYPLISVPYDEPGWFGKLIPADEDGPINPVNKESKGENMEEQLSLTDYLIRIANEEQCSCACGDPDCDFPEDEDFTAKLAFTNTDLSIMEKVVAKKVRSLRKALDNTSELHDKLRTLQNLRQC